MLQNVQTEPDGVLGYIERRCLFSLDVFNRPIYFGDRKKCFRMSKLSPTVYSGTSSGDVCSVWTFLTDPLFFKFSNVFPLKQKDVIFTEKAGNKTFLILPS